MRVYAVALAKGGSTKTTTAAELAQGLAGRGLRVLALDLDQQGNLTTRLGITRSTEVEATAADVLTGEATPQQAAVTSPAVPGVDVVAGTSQLAGVEHLPEIAAALRDELPALTDWDAVVIDTPPALGVITLAALAAADTIVAPVTCEAEAYEQLTRLGTFVGGRVARLSPQARIAAVIPTRFDSRRRLDREVVELLGEKWPEQIRPPVREGVVAKDAYIAGQPVGRYAPDSGVARDYADALEPLLASSHATSERTS